MKRDVSTPKNEVTKYEVRDLYDALDEDMASAMRSAQEDYEKESGALARTRKSARRVFGGRLNKRL